MSQFFSARRLSLCLSLGVALAAVGLPVRAEKPMLKVMINDVAPYSWRRDDVIVGMHVDLMRALAEQAEVDMEMRSGAYARLIRGFKDGWADLVLALKNPEMDAEAVWVGRMHSFRSIIISRHLAPISAVSQLKGKQLGMARGAFYSESINNDDEIRKFGITDPFQGVRMLAAGRLDAVISSDYLLKHALRQSGLEMSQFAPTFVVNELSYALYARKDLPESLLQRLHAALETLERQGRLAALLRPYE
ncbi:transporter substrate-binding domain-containing protein [Paucibacter sp. APW11]|uniref:Transporter substrate-binding domain-containing protein n=1 Tax=Roseateles aquae TaxID=3077235 RepID=A0ABU3P960_9BURK|nr:transporter substrate-binding domain-containing protein [Paucibacter sp. APW11]MDT8999121.1 transporter substrate-binding domain-containing protein [Paucibacter sp. APW11]